MQIDISDREFDILCSLLEEHCTTLSHEIHKTDTREFKDHLKAEESTSVGLLAKLRTHRGG